jgi:hypothetical protein
MMLIPTHETSLQEVIARVISAHVFDILDGPAILHVLSSFGCLASQVIVKLVRNGQVITMNESEVLQKLAQALHSRCHCRNCSVALNVRMESGEFQYGTFRCAACHTRNF